VEFRAEDQSVPIKPEHKMSKVQINKEMKANGFKLVREYDGLPWQHLMFFGKAEKGDGAVQGAASPTPGMSLLRLCRHEKQGKHPAII